MSMKKSSEKIRKERVRYKLKTVGASRPRLSVHRTARHIYVQIIDDVRQVTLAAASTLAPDVKKALKATGNKDAAKLVGKEIAKVAAKAGVKEIVFDRGAYLYHGRVQALAEAAREAGLKF